MRAEIRVPTGVHSDRLSPSQNKLLDEIFGTEYCPARCKEYRKQNGLANSGHRRNLMNRHKHPYWRAAALTIRRSAVAFGVMLVLASPALAQTGTSPWENAVNVLQQSFTGTIAKGLSLVAIVVGGLTFAFGEGAGKRTFAGIVFGIGMAVLAVNFMTWLFGV
jgi:type IV secretory pathway VirB2 component (pilin)